MEKITSLPSLSPNNKTTTNPSQLLVDQDDLDKLSNQLKLLKIDDLTINKILKKFKPIKNEVKTTGMSSTRSSTTTTTFVGYNGLFELAISQVIQCGYGHVLPFNFFGTKKRILKNKNSATNLILIKQQKIFKMGSKNINKQLKLAKINLAIKQTDLMKKMTSKKGEENNDIIETMLAIHKKCVENIFSDTRRPLKRKRNQAEVLAPQENFREASVAAFTPEPQMNLNFSAALNGLANAPTATTARTEDNYVTKRNKTGSKTNNGVFEVEEENESATEKRKKKKKTKNGDMSNDGPSSFNKEN
uniref:Uncharacterized protein n=1 Tax=Meloidogyne enterolobii TaxID=390850 RepID=A0A6V7TWN3_MELEN|nr:unnamed protein product [Meloidogyne enterolobii]